MDDQVHGYRQACCEIMKCGHPLTSLAYRCRECEKDLKSKVKIKIELLEAEVKLLKEAVGQNRRASRDAKVEMRRRERENREREAEAELVGTCDLPNSSCPLCVAYQGPECRYTTRKPMAPGEYLGPVGPLAERVEVPETDF